MNKSELANIVAKKAQVRKKDAADVCNALYETIIETLEKQEKILIPGFMVFEVVERGPRRHSVNWGEDKGKIVTLPAKKVATARITAKLDLN